MQQREEALDPALLEAARPEKLVELDDKELSSVCGGYSAGPNNSWSFGPNDSW